MQKRLIRKLDLELLLSQVKPHPTPKPDLEQYTIPADVAATMLHIAAYSNNDIVDKTVLDLGCGTGRLALGAAFLGARQVVGVDVDRTAINTAYTNSVRIDLRGKVQWVAADVAAIHGSFDTVLQNPPYGVQKRGADRKFLEKALEVGKSVYSLHKNRHEAKTFVKELRAGSNGIVPVAPSPFLKEFIERHGGRIKGVYTMAMTIPHMFSFHTKRRHEFLVDLYVLEGK
jgi:putative methylase